MVVLGVRLVALRVPGVVPLGLVILGAPFHKLVVVGRRIEELLILGVFGVGIRMRRLVGVDLEALLVPGVLLSDL